MQKSLCSQLVKHRLHLVVIKRLSRIAVKFYVQSLIYPIDLFERNALEIFKQFQSFCVAVFDSLKPSSCLIAKIGIGLFFFMESDVYVYKRAHASLLDLLLAAPTLECNYKFAKLRTPIAEVIDTHYVVAKRSIYAIDCTAQRSIEQMPHMERLCYIDGRIVDADSLAVALIALAVILSLGKHILQSLLGKRYFVEFEVDKSGNRRDFFYHLALCHALRDLVRNRHRGFLHLLGKLKARDAEIAHRAVFGYRDKRKQFALVYALNIYTVDNKLFVIHIYSLNVKSILFPRHIKR